MPAPDFTAAPSKTPCADCAKVIRKGQFCVLLHERFYLCSQDCVESFRDSFVGRDFVAAHDQAISSATEIITGSPHNFILLYSEDEYSINSCVMADPSFVLACVPILAQMSTFEGDVEPPD